MTEDSGCYDDGSGGDDATAILWSSLYSAAERADYLSIILAGDVPECFVAPGVLNELKAIERLTPQMSVQVGTGKAFMKGYIYGNDGVKNVTIAAADGSNPRWDRIVLRHTFADAEIRLAVLTGTPGASPALPALTQDGTTWEADLAHVLVNASVTEIYDEDIWDKRQFIPGFDELNKIASRHNLVPNSEFLAGEALLGTVPKWVIALLSVATEAKDAQQERGQALELTSTSSISDSFSTSFTCKANTRYCLKMLVKITSGELWRLRFLDDSTAPVIQIRDFASAIDDWQVLTMFLTTGSDPTLLTLEINELGTAAGKLMSIGQVMVFPGNIPGDFQTNHEVIFFGDPMTDAAYNGDAFASSTEVVDLLTNFNSFVAADQETSYRGFYFRLRIRDSGSAAGSPSVNIEDIANNETFATIGLEGVPDDEWRSINFWVPTYTFDMVIVATGAGTLDIFLQLLGVAT